MFDWFVDDSTPKILANYPNFIKDFIDLYRKNKCLWKIKSLCQQSFANDSLSRITWTVEKQ